MIESLKKQQKNLNRKNCLLNYATVTTKLFSSSQQQISRRRTFLGWSVAWGGLFDLLNYEEKDCSVYHFSFHRKVRGQALLQNSSLEQGGLQWFTCCEGSFNPDGLLLIIIIFQISKLKKAAVPAKSSWLITYRYICIVWQSQKYSDYYHIVKRREAVHFNSWGAVPTNDDLIVKMLQVSFVSSTNWFIV